MPLSKDTKSGIIDEYKRAETDTGSTEVQWAGVPLITSDPSVGTGADGVVLPPSTGAWLQS